MFIGDVSAQKLILISDLREEFLVESDLLDEADDGLLLFVLEGHAAHLDHLLLLLGLQVAFDVVLVHELVDEGVVDHAVVEGVVVGLH